MRKSRVLKSQTFGQIKGLQKRSQSVRQVCHGTPSQESIVSRRNITLIGLLLDFSRSFMSLPAASSGPARQENLPSLPHLRLK